MIVYGAGGMAKDLLFSFPDEQFTFFDNVNPITELYGRPVINRYEDLPERFDFIIGVADNRRKIHDMLVSRGGTQKRILSPHAMIGKSKIGKAIISAGVQVTTNAIIGDGVFLNKRVIVPHDCVVGDFSVLSPGVILGGGAIVGEDVFMGIGAITLPRVTIGDGSIIGAGAVVTKDIKSGTHVGVPARKL